MDLLLTVTILKAYAIAAPIPWFIRHASTTLASYAASSDAHRYTYANATTTGDTRNGIPISRVLENSATTERAANAEW